MKTNIQTVSDWLCLGHRSLNPAWFPPNSARQWCPTKAWVPRGEEAAWSRGKDFRGICTHQLWGLRQIILTESIFPWKWSMSFLTLQSVCDAQTRWHVRTFCTWWVWLAVLYVSKVTVIRALDTDFNGEAGREVHNRGSRHSRWEEATGENPSYWGSRLGACLVTFQVLPCVWCPSKNNCGCPHPLGCVSLVKNPMIVFMANY